MHIRNQVAAARGNAAPTQLIGYAVNRTGEGGGNWPPPRGADRC